MVQVVAAPGDCAAAAASSIATQPAQASRRREAAAIDVKEGADWDGVAWRGRPLRWEERDGGSAALKCPE
jgi:hypothetical protein